MSCRSPVTGVNGLIASQDGQAMSGFWRNGDVVQIEGAGHRVRYDCYEPFIEVIRHFWLGFEQGLTSVIFISQSIRRAWAARVPAGNTGRSLAGS